MLHRVLTTIIVSLFIGCANDMIAPRVPPKESGRSNEKMNDKRVLSKCSHCGTLMEGPHALRGGENNNPHITINFKPLVIVFDRDKPTPVATVATGPASNSEDQVHDGSGETADREIPQALAPTGNDLTPLVRTDHVSTDVNAEVQDGLGSEDEEVPDGLGPEEAAETSVPPEVRSEEVSHDEFQSTREDEEQLSSNSQGTQEENDGISADGAVEVREMGSLKVNPQHDDSASGGNSNRYDEVRLEGPSEIPSDVPAETASFSREAVVVAPQNEALLTIPKTIKPEYIITPQDAVEKVSQMAAALLVNALPNYMKMIKVPKKTIHADYLLLLNLPLKQKGVLSMINQFRSFMRPSYKPEVKPPLCKITLVVEMSNVWHLVSDRADMRDALVKRMDAALALPPTSPSFCIGEDLFPKAMLVAWLSDVAKSELYRLFSTISFLRLILLDSDISAQEKAFIDLLTAVSDSPNEYHSHLHTASTLLQSLQSMVKEYLKLT